MNKVITVKKTHTKGNLEKERKQENEGQGQEEEEDSK